MKSVASDFWYVVTMRLVNVLALKKNSYVDGQRLFLGIPKVLDQVTADPFLTRKFWNLKKKYFAKIFIDR